MLLCTFVDYCEIISTLLDMKSTIYTGLKGHMLMKINTLGVVLSYYREKYGFSQEEICNGICSVPTLSRAEQGVRAIDSLMGESLLGRIGKGITRFELILNDEDYDKWKHRDTIQRLVKKKDYEAAKKCINAYREQLTEEQHLHHQFCRYYEVKIAEARSEDVKIVSDMALEALILTKPDFRYNITKKQAYTPIEIELLVSIIHANCTKVVEDPEMELNFLFHYVKRYYSGRVMERLGTRILIELIEVRQKNGDHMKVIEYVDKAISFISEGRGIQQIAMLHFTKAKAIQLLYSDTVKWEIWEAECKRECMMAYCTYFVQNDEVGLSNIEKYCEEVLRWQITRQGTLSDLQEQLSVCLRRS